MNKLLRFVFLCFVLALATGAVFAQGVTSALTGLVADSSHAVVADATITATEISSGVQSTAHTSSAGYYRIPVPPGTYRVEAAAAGFAKAVAEHVVVSTAQVVTSDFSLQVGSIKDTVTVVAEVPLISVSSAEVSGSVTPQQFQTLPIFVSDGGRNAQSFMYMTLPGANAAGGSINGGQTASQKVLIDGVSLGRYDYNDGLGEFTPSTDAIGEFNAQMSTYSAEYGGTGGGISNFTMKSGTNQFHGSAYELNRNPAYAANGVVNNTFGRAKGNLKDNDFGATFGGPIRKDRTFFYVSYEGDRYRNLNLGTLATLPTKPMIGGDFSAWLGGAVGTDALGRQVYSGEIYNPLTTRTVAAGATDPVTGLVNNTSASAIMRDPFMYNGRINVIDPQYLSKASSILLPKWPSPMNSDLINNAVSFNGNMAQLTRNAESIKIDHVINDSMKLTAFVNNNSRSRYLKNGTATVPYDPLNPLSTYKVQYTGGPMARLSHTWTVNSHSVNQLTVAYNRFYNDNNNPPDGGKLAKELNLANVDSRCMPTIRFSYSAGRRGPANVLAACRDYDPSESRILQNTFSTVKGKHSLKFGGEYTGYHYNTFDQYTTGGTFTFTDSETSLQGFNSKTGHPYASFLLGAVSSGSNNIFPETFGYRQALWSFFAQDDYKLSPRLTVNVGLRWELPVPKTEQHDRMSGFDPTLPNSGADGYLGSLAFVGNCETCMHRRSFQDWYMKNFGPRIGLAYQLSNKLVFRGGYGISYEPPLQWGFGFQTMSGWSGNVPYVAHHSPTGFYYDPTLYWSPLSGASVPAGVSTAPVPFTGTLPSYDSTQMNGNGLDFVTKDSLRLPYIQTWSLGFQFELPRLMMLEANYVGNKGTRLMNSFAGFSGMVNQAPGKYMGLGDILTMDMADALKDPVASKALAAYGITGLPYPGFEQNNWDTTVGTALTPYPQYSSLLNLTPNYGNSTYHSAQLTLRKQSTSGLTFIASYTFSKLLSDTDSAMYGAGGVQDFYNRRLEKSIASFDQTHAIKVAWMYSLPFGHGKRWLNRNGITDKVFGGWEISAIQNYFSGDPLQIVSGYAPGISMGTLRASFVPGQPLTIASKGVDVQQGTPYLNPAAFTDPVHGGDSDFALAVGNTPRYLPNVRGPFHPSESFALMKDTHLTESMVFQIRGEAFNAFNRTVRGDPDTTVGSPTFGRIMSVWTPYGGTNTRVLQLSGRITF